MGPPTVCSVLLQIPWLYLVKGRTSRPHGRRTLSSEGTQRPGTGKGPSAPVEEAMTAPASGFPLRAPQRLYRRLSQPLTSCLHLPNLSLPLSPGSQEFRVKKVTHGWGYCWPDAQEMPVPAPTASGWHRPQGRPSPRWLHQHTWLASACLPAPGTVTPGSAPWALEEWENRLCNPQESTSSEQRPKQELGSS